MEKNFRSADGRGRIFRSVMGVIFSKRETVGNRGMRMQDVVMQLLYTAEEWVWMTGVMQMRV